MRPMTRRATGLADNAQYFMGRRVRLNKRGVKIRWMMWRATSARPYGQDGDAAAWAPGSAASPAERDAAKARLARPLGRHYLHHQTHRLSDPEPRW